MFAGAAWERTRSLLKSENEKIGQFQIHLGRVVDSSAQFCERLAAYHIHIYSHSLKDVPVTISDGIEIVPNPSNTFHELDPT